MFLVTACTGSVCESRSDDARPVVAVDRVLPQDHVSVGGQWHWLHLNWSGSGFEFKLDSRYCSTNYAAGLR